MPRGESSRKQNQVSRRKKRAWKAEEGGRRRRVRPKLRLKDSVKRNLERADTNGQEWTTIAEDRGRWRELTTKVKKLPSAVDSTPQGNKGKKKTMTPASHYCSMSNIITSSPPLSLPQNRSLPSHSVLQSCHLATCCPSPSRPSPWHLSLLFPGYLALL